MNQEFISSKDSGLDDGDEVVRLELTICLMTYRKKEP